ncbi:MAG: oxidoreductase, partial [Fulvivirga sp.]|nr:oxidoreductase [Fulvivirga sp.]
MAFSFFKKNKESEKEKKPATGSSRYYDLKVKEIIHETKDAITIVFEQPENKVNYKSGQFLTLIVNVDGKEVRR